MPSRDTEALWRSRLRWRLRGAMLWPVFAVAVVVDTVLLQLLPIAGEGRPGVVVLAAGLLALGLAHRPALVAEQDDFAAQSQAVRDYVVSSAAAEYRGKVDRADTWRQGPDLFRTCVPGDDPRRALCLIVTTDQSPPGVTVDPDQRPNSRVAGPDNPGRQDG